MATTLPSATVKAITENSLPSEATTGDGRVEGAQSQLSKEIEMGKLIATTQATIDGVKRFDSGVVLLTYLPAS